jgi:hypothetical protein
MFQGAAIAAIAKISRQMPAGCNWKVAAAPGVCLSAAGFSYQE